jgi:hypothetical protein
MENVKVTVDNEPRADRVPSFLAGVLTVWSIMMLYCFVTDYEETCKLMYAMACLSALVSGCFAFALATTYTILYGVYGVWYGVCYCVSAIGKLFWYVNDLLERVESSIIDCYFQIGVLIGPMRYLCVHIVALGATLYYYM